MGFQHTEQACPISCQFPDGLIYQHVSDSVPSRVLIKLEQSRAILAQHVKAPKQDLTQQLVLMRLGSRAGCRQVDCARLCQPAVAMPVQEGQRW